MRHSFLAFMLAAAFGASAAETPQLIIVVSIDQLRFDLPDKYAPWLTPGGFKRFSSSGAVFANTRFRHAVTFTGPGHASIGTGMLPAEHGIVGNTWFERDAPRDEKRWEWYFDDIVPYRNRPRAEYTLPEGATPWWHAAGSPRYCAYDDHVEVTAGTTPGMSPVSMAEAGLGDRLKDRYPDARVIGVALKDRASVLMAGRRADAAYWFDSAVPAFVSSSYYRFNPEVLKFNELLKGYIPGSQQWSPGPFIPPADLRRVTFDPPEAWPLKNDRYGGTFPHPAEDLRAVTYSPFGHELLLDFALHVIATEKLGSRTGTPDVLFVGVSSTDYLGHYYGPDSMEVADSTVRLDRALAHFFDAVERRAPGRVVIALTADHGVQPNPEIARLRDPHADTGRVDVRVPDANATRIAELPPVRIAMERQLAKRLRIPFSENAPLGQALIYFFEEPALFLNWPRVAELKLDGERVKRELRDIVRGMKEHGFADAWTSTEMITPNPSASPMEVLMRNSYRSDRGGDVLMALRPGWIWYWGSNSTSHGQPVEDDLHVPLMFWGAGIKPGRYEGDSAPSDLARTLGVLLGVDAGGRAANVLPCVR
jgi:arylsulfatase A-like enzyme